MCLGCLPPADHHPELETHRHSRRRPHPVVAGTHRQALLPVIDIPPAYDDLRRMHLEAGQQTPFHITVSGGWRNSTNARGHSSVDVGAIVGVRLRCHGDAVYRSDSSLRQPVLAKEDRAQWIWWITPGTAGPHLFSGAGGPRGTSLRLSRRRMCTGREGIASSKKHAPVPQCMLVLSLVARGGSWCCLRMYGFSRRGGESPSGLARMRRVMPKQ